MEIWDLYNEKRESLVKTHERGSEFSEGEYYLCTEVWVVNPEGKLLITQRHPSKKLGEMWEFSGGGVLTDERTSMAAVRGLQEEIGLQVEERELNFLATYQARNYFMDIFVVYRDIDLKSLKLQEKEVIDSKLVSPEDFQGMAEKGLIVKTVARRYELYKNKLKKGLRILITGMSGTGKSTALERLKEKGYRVVDTDSDEWSHWVILPDGFNDWIWREDAISDLLTKHQYGALFVAGCKTNQGKFYPLFDHVVLLSAPAPVILERVASRDNNPYGKSPEERELILRHLAEVEPLLRARATVEIDASLPLEEVVSRLEQLANSNISEDNTHL